MKIILMKDVPKVGKRFETKDISDGYALNLLIPKGLAVAATPDMMKKVELEKARTEGEKKVHDELLVKNLTELDGATVAMLEKANDKGHLFAAVHKLEVVDAIQKQTRIQIDPEYIILDKPIKETGSHEIEVRAAGKSIRFKLDIKKA